NFNPSMDVSGDPIPPQALTPPSRRTCILLIALFTGIVFAQTLRFDFVSYDDYELVYQNGDFLSHVSNVFTSFATHVFTTHRAESGYYRPLVLVSFIVDYQVWGLNPFGYHLTNLLVHLCTVLALFLLLEKLLRDAVPALAGSLLFALHPVQTSAVAWVAGRN